MPFLPTNVTIVDADGNSISVSTQATLAALLTELQAKTEPADQQHVIVDSAPASASAADVLTADADAGYTDGATGEPLTQTPDGRLRVVNAGLVSDVPESYVTGQVRSLSINTDGRLRVSVVQAPIMTQDDYFDDFSSTGEVSWHLLGGPWGTYE